MGSPTRRHSEGAELGRPLPRRSLLMGREDSHPSRYTSPVARASQGRTHPEFLARLWRHLAGARLRPASHRLSRGFVGARRRGRTRSNPSENGPPVNEDRRPKARPPQLHRKGRVFLQTGFVDKDPLVLSTVRDAPTTWPSSPAKTRPKRSPFPTLSVRLSMYL